MYETFENEDLEWNEGKSGLRIRYIFFRTWDDLVAMSGENSV
jgi:hypothetical protein